MALENIFTVYHSPNAAAAPNAAEPESPELVAWRQPAAEFAARDLALAYIGAGTEDASPNGS